MQVKKFEAKSMKEALQLVKQELGPEAIILNAKDNKKFGLAGRGSVEVTAAISERSLQKKHYAESRLPDDAKEKFRAKSAKHQKSFIETTVNRYQQRQANNAANAAAATQNVATAAAIAASASRAFETSLRRPRVGGSGARYIDIPEEEVIEPALSGRRVDDILEDFARTGSYVLEDAANKAQVRFAQNAPQTLAQQHAQARAAQNQTPAGRDLDEVTSLRREVDALRDLLSQVQNGQGGKPLTQHPGAEYGLPFELSPCFEKLHGAGIDTRYIVEILEKADKELSGLEKKKRSLIEAWVARYIMSHTNVVGAWLPSSKAKVHLFLGPAGHGKTSALVKMASHLVIHERKKVAIFTADTFKVGAADQLRIYSQILNIPFETVKHTMEFPQFLNRYSDYDAILVDYPGFSLKEIHEIDQVRALLPAREIPKVVHLCLASTLKEIDAYEICHRYQVTHFDDILATKVDESFAHGILYNLQRKTEKPLYAFGIGSKIPEDIELATRERVLDLIYKITKKSI